MGLIKAQDKGVEINFCLGLYTDIVDNEFAF
jgi:hypothetical protein